MAVSNATVHGHLGNSSERNRTSPVRLESDKVSTAGWVDTNIRCHYPGSLPIGPREREMLLKLVSDPCP